MEKCVLCGSKKFSKKYEVDGKTIAACYGCDLVRTLAFDEPNYKEYHRDNDYEHFKEHFKNIFLTRYNIINRFHPKPGKVLDIGTSTGTMLDIFSEKGWETWGVEPSGSSIIAKAGGHKIINKAFEVAKLPKEYFDVVVMNHTLEHVADPLEVLEKISLVLKKRGIVLIDVPNYGSLSRQVFGKDWQYFTPTEHIHHFNRLSMAALFKKAGLNPEYYKSRSGIFEYSNPIFDLWQALIGRKKRLFTDLAGAPWALVATLINRGNSFSFVARKI